MKHIAYYQLDGVGRWVSSIAEDAKVPEVEGLLFLEVSSPITGPFHVVDGEIKEGEKPSTDLKTRKFLVAQEIRAKRARLLQESDWIVTKSVESGVPVPVEWRLYRQALRDIPSQDPELVLWPEKPT